VRHYVDDLFQETLESEAKLACLDRIWPEVVRSLIRSTLTARDDVSVHDPE
jgi:hypothetical protein